MVTVITLLIIFWTIRTVKQVLFWIYLWQLKEYHIWRFVDHFRTYKGRKIFVNALFGVKIILLPLLFFSPEFAWLLLGIYILESALFAWHIIKKNFKKPVITLKAQLLSVIGVSVICTFAIMAYHRQLPPIYILLFDILIPVVISAVVLLIQPFFYVARLQTLKKAALKIAAHDKLIVIGITGSYGKTSTKEFLTTILSSRFTVLSTPAHRNSEMGIAQTILEDLKPHHKIFVVEMGAYQKGGIKLLCDMVKPDIGIVTGVNQQHLATFGSLENLLSAEGGRELVMALPGHGLVILNGENEYCTDLYKKMYNFRKDIRKQLYVVEKNRLDADIWTEDAVVKEHSVSFIARTKEKEIMPFAVNVAGRQNIQNLLGAILVAKELGMGMEQIHEACKKIEPQQAGMVAQKGIYGINIIDSSYSSNPDGVMADLDYLNAYKGSKVVIMPCLIELGAASAEVHKKIGEKIARVCDMAIITTKDQFENIKMGAKEVGMRENQIILCDNPEEIMSHITTICKEGDAVLLEGRVPGELIKKLQSR